MKQIIISLLGVYLIFFLNACSGRHERPQPQGKLEPVEVVPLYDLFARGDSAAVMGPYHAESVALLEAVQYLREVPDTARAAALWSNSLPVAVFTPAVDSILGDSKEFLPRLGEQLAYMREAARLEGIDFPQNRHYAAVVYGRNEPYGFVDSVMLIALNHYLGVDYPGYERFPVHIRFQKQTEYLPYDLAEGQLADSQPYMDVEDESGLNTNLSRMLYSGALALGRTMLVKDADSAVALGYSQEQWKWLLDNEASMWRKMVANGLLFDTSAVTGSRLLGPAPATPLLDIHSPGRAGRFIGYRMVKGYLDKHPETTLKELLSPAFYQDPDILARLGYSPR